jgi:hypothetical protein
MPTLNIEGRSVQVDDSFLKLPPDQQHATVDEIAKSFSAPASFNDRFTAEAAPKGQPSVMDAVTDIPKEMGSAVTTAMQHVSGNSVSDLPGFDPRTRGQLGPIEGLLRTGKQVLGVPELIASLPIGLARSVVGHLMAQGEHAVGTLIAPDIAAKDDPQKMYETAKGDVDTALSAVGSRGAVGSRVLTPKVEAPTIPELKASASGKEGSPGGYQGTELSSLDVKPRAISDYAAKTKVSLDAAGIDENLAPKTHAILNRLESVPNDATAIVSGKNIMSLRKLLGNAAGEPGQEGLAASRAMRALDEHIPTIEAKDVLAGEPEAAGKALETANADYSAAKHAETIDNKTIRAELRAAASNSGHNVANTIRQRMADLINPERPDLQRGFQPDELAMMERIVRGTKTQNAMRWAGNYLGGGGGLGALHTSGIGAGIGAAVAGPIGAAVGAVAPPAIGHILKAIGNAGTLADAAKLSEMIRSRAPLASSAEKYNQAAAAFETAQNSKTYAAALIAARNLSSNLRGAGLNVAPTDLLKGLQSPAPAQADDQQQVPRPPGQ